MTTPPFTFDRALHEVTLQSAGGAPFLIAYGVTFLITGVLSFFLPRETTALSFFGTTGDLPGVRHPGPDCGI